METIKTPPPSIEETDKAIAFMLRQREGEYFYYGRILARAVMHLRKK